MLDFDQAWLISEVKKRPALWSPDHPGDRDQKLALWKEIGAAMFADWHTYSKGMAYDRAMLLQKKWRSLRDSYRREIRARASGVRANKTVYRYFNNMSFLLGLYETGTSDTIEQASSEHENTVLENEDTEENRESIDLDSNDPQVSFASTSGRSLKKPRKRKVKKAISDDEDFADETPVFSSQMSESETDSDKLFLLSFLPEMKQLPVNIKMWARAQIANVMQEAVSCHYNNETPNRLAMKRIKRQESSD